MSYWRRVGGSISQMLNVVFLNGHQDESLSARSYRTVSMWETVIDGILGKDHCRKAYQTDIKHAKELLAKY